MKPKKESKIVAGLNGLMKSSERTEGHGGWRKGDNFACQKRYLIDAKWWRKWCDYTNFSQDTQAITPPRESLDAPSSAGGTTALIETSNVIESFYSKPGPITNKDLLEEGNLAKSACGDSGKLKKNMVLHFDFVYVDKETWQHLYSWYSADYTVFKYLKKDATSDRVFLDLYPEERFQSESRKKL